jgi:hypothetical protein
VFPEKFLTTQFRSELDDLIARFLALRKRFNDALLLQAVADIDDIAGANGKSFMSDLSLDSHLFSSVSAEEERLLKGLRPIERTEHVDRCMPGTRKNILEKIDHWLDDLDAPNILWLSGGPGAGKSAIASTVVSELWERRRLGSSFFFKRGHATLGDPASLWRTVAFDLARFDAGIKEIIIAKLKDRQGITERTDIELHFRHLIDEPLQKARDRPSANPTVVVIDALDECGSQRKPLLNTFKSWSALHPAFKLLVTSRDEHDISKVLIGITQHFTLPTGQLVEPHTTNDIFLFFQKRLAEIADDYPDSLQRTWPGASTLEELSRRAAGLFIWADTVVKLVSEGAPDDQLSLVLEGSAQGVDINTLYCQILDRSLGSAGPGVLDAFKAVMGSIILAKTPLGRSDLKYFLSGIAKDALVDWILNKLSSVLSTGQSDGLLRVSHQSFTDFLTDPNQCPGHFLVDCSKRSVHIARSCLQMMNEGLKFNICSLGTSYIRNDEVPDLPARVVDAITSRLSYSCRFWGQHVADISNMDLEAETLLPDISTFLRGRLLYWLEVLSLIKEVPTAIQTLVSAAKWIQVDFLHVICLEESESLT